MKWLNQRIGNLLEACGLSTDSRLGGSVQFFIYDTIKIMLLLGVLILVISYDEHIRLESGNRVCFAGRCFIVYDGRYHLVPAFHDYASESGKT